MRELKLNKEQSNAFLIMLTMAKLSKQCITSEKNGMGVLTIHVNRKAPQSDRGVVIPGKPRLMGDFISQTEKGWIASVKCSDFREFLEKAFDDTPENLINLEL